MLELVNNHLTHGETPGDGIPWPRGPRAEGHQDRYAVSGVQPVESGVQTQ